MEYEVIKIAVSDGTEKEFAIIDKFEFNNKKYMSVSLIEDDEIQEGMYIYGYIDADDGDVVVEIITDMQEYDDVTEYYLELAD